jgi:hypothetical protein
MLSQRFADDLRDGHTGFVGASGELLSTAWSMWSSVIRVDGRTRGSPQSISRPNPSDVLENPGTDRQRARLRIEASLCQVIFWVVRERVEESFWWRSGLSGRSVVIGSRK